MKISIITVCYNAVGTIADAIESILAQNFPGVEFIVVDGASTDGTLNIIDSFRKNISIVISERDGGIYEAMNKGLALATGDVIGFLNADDVYADDSILARVAAFFASDGLDALFADAEFFNGGDPKRTVRRYSSARFSPDRIGWGWMPAHPTLFLHRRVFERFGDFRTDYRIAGDFELVARIFKAGDLTYSYVPDVFVRMRSGGISTGGWWNTFVLNREVLRACRENGIRSNIFMVLSKYLWKFFELRRV